MDHLLTEAHNPASTNLDELTPLQFVRLMNSEDARIIPAIASQAEAIARAIEVIADRLNRGGRLIYAGAGTSGRLGILDASECPPTFSAPPGQVVGIIAGGARAITQSVEGAEDRPEFAVEDLTALHLSALDVVVGIATSGRTPYVVSAIKHSHKLGAFTIGMSCTPDSEVANASELPITLMVGPEVLNGSTRLKAGSATKMVLNMLSTGAMIRNGKTLGDLMVDLQATNVKLLARANRIVRTLTGITSEAAITLLEQCNGELKTALVTHLANCSPAEARQRLRSASGQVRKVVPARKEPVAGKPYDGILLLGIDGGGTHTVAMLATADRTRDRPIGWTIVGRGSAGPSNHNAVGKERALEALDQAVARAYVDADVQRRPADFACLGLAGVDRPGDLSLVRHWNEQRRFSNRLEIINDASLLLAAGTPEGWGIALVSGTGSIAYGRAQDGSIERAGGWGHILGDEGSAYGMVAAAMRAAARAADQRGESTLLLGRLMNKLDLAKPGDLIPTVYGGGWDRARLATLAPLVMETAEVDAVARRIVVEAAEELALAAATVARKLSLTKAKIPMALTGGVLVANPDFRVQILSALSREGIKVDPVALVTEPADGAIKIAAAQASAQG